MREQVLDVVEGVLLGRHHGLDVAGLLLHARAAEFGGGDVLAGDLPDHVRAGDVHLGLAVHRHNEVRGHRRVDGAAGGFAQHDGDLRHAARQGQLALRDLRVHGQGRHRVLDTGAAGVLDADHRARDLDGELHDLGDLAPERHAD